MAPAGSTGCWPGQLVIRSCDSLLGSDLGSSRLLSCSTVPQNLTSASPLRAADTKIPHTRGHRAREDGTNLYGGILLPGRYAAPPPRSDEGFPRGYCDDLSDYARTAAFSTAPSGPSPWVT